MTEKEKLKQAALEWLDDWNNRNLEKVMTHYADDVKFYSSTVIRRWSGDGMKLKEN